MLACSMVHPPVEFVRYQMPRLLLPAPATAACTKPSSSTRTSGWLYLPSAANSGSVHSTCGLATGDASGDGSGESDGTGESVSTGSSEGSAVVEGDSADVGSGLRVASALDGGSPVGSAVTAAGDRTVPGAIGGVRSGRDG